ncbi:predicted protein [Deinococcus grandis]|uniref:Uncharacterized protein n=1 Tax=Deinococcus grandis TaxID=57498 RepID=A0A100HMG3_9DEIO|nr:hypothetical protein DEGR_10590 [Deinococcus grandis]GAQ22174.1 predicted protein [Deinococcus grandis]
MTAAGWVCAWLGGLVVSVRAASVSVGSIGVASIGVGSVSVGSIGLGSVLARRTGVVAAVRRDGVMVPRG